jgi:PAS domain S-box-containing protein
MEKKLGEPGYVNKNCWLAKNLGYPPSRHCQYCEIKFHNCLFFRYLMVSLVIIFAIIVLSFLVEGKISTSLIIAIFILVITYGYFFDKSTQKIIESSFAQRQAKESLEELSKNLKQKVAEQTKDIKMALEAEKKSKVEDEALLASIGDGVIAVDKDGKIMFINGAAEQMLQIKTKDVISKPYEEVLHIENEKGEMLSKEKNRLYEVLKRGQRVATDTSSLDSIFYYVRTDKSRFPVAVTIAPVVLDGNIYGAVSVFRDITIERQIDKSKSEFVSLASHQLRTPLSAIKWYSEMLLSGKSGKLSVKQKKYINEVSRGNERMIKLIDVLLSVSRLEAGSIKVNPKVIDVKTLIRGIIEEQKFNMKKKKQKFTPKCVSVEVPQIYADPDLIRIVFQNIISNAVKYTPEKGEITCNIEKRDNDVLFQIKDTGIGIPKDQQSRVFEKLFRASNAFSHDPEGNGLGLYLAKTTVESFGGKIWFESEEGKGTTFYISMPLAESK